MPSKRSDEARDYAFGDQLLTLRKRASLTQAELAILLDVSKRSVEGWEAGLAYPSVTRLTALIILFLERGLFITGQEVDEAEAIWNTVRQRAAQRIPPFEPRSFTIPPHASNTTVPTLPPRPAGDLTQRHDWGEAPGLPVLHGRDAELATLTQWVRDERCRGVEVLGVGGIGKTSLAAQSARDLSPDFAVIYWRSLRNALPAAEWLAGAIAAFSLGQAVPPAGFDACLGLLLELLRAKRGLLVLDNLETILEPTATEVRYRAGQEGYGVVLQRLASSAHQSCLLLTSREQALPADGTTVRTLRLDGLAVEAGRSLLERRALVGDAASWGALVDRFAGNPLALRVVGETIGVVFGGDIAAFLEQDVAVFGGIRQLLDEQVGRLSALEREIGICLAVEREPVGFAELVSDLGPGTARGDLVEAVEALQRRSLLEWGSGGSFTLQPVVLEYVTSRLIAAVAREILTDEPDRLVGRALLKAGAKDYVRRSQEQLIGRPLLERLHNSLGPSEMVERQLLKILGAWRNQSSAAQGYGPGNVVNLLRLLRGDLRGLDLSHLYLRQIYLQGVDVRDATLAGAHLTEAVLAEAFHYSTSVALSADGASLAAGTDTGGVELWRVSDRTLLMAVQAHGGPVLGVALSGDGRLIASGSFDRTVKLWEVPNGRLLATLLGHVGGVWGVAMSRDGRLAASGSYDGTVNLWETGPESASPDRLPTVLQDRTDGVYGVALSGDGRLVAGAGFDGTVKLWEAASAKLLTTLRGHTAAVRGVALSEDGRLVAAGSYDGTVKLWEAPSGKLLATLEGHTGGVYAVALSADGQLVASGGLDGTVKLWEAAPAIGSPGQLLTTLQGHTGGIESVALSGDGRLAASAGLDGTVRLWEAPNGRPLATLQGHVSGIQSTVFSRDGLLVAGGSFDGTVKLWDVVNGRLLVTLLGHTGAVSGVALSADGRLVASSGFDGTVRLWEALPTGRLLATLEGHVGGVLSVALSAAGDLVASGGDDGTIRLWDARPAGESAGRLLTTAPGHGSGVLSVALSEDGRLAVSGSYDGTVKLWEMPGGKLLGIFQGHTGGIYTVALSTDGRMVAAGSQDGTVTLWTVLPPSEDRAHQYGLPSATLRGHTGGVWGVALSRDGRMVVSGSFDRTVKLWDVRSGRLTATLEGHTDGVRSVALSADGRLAAGGSYDGSIKLWEVGSGACLSTLRSDRPYERLDITGLTGLTKPQRAVLLALGALDRTPPPAAQPAPKSVAHPLEITPAEASTLMPTPLHAPADPRTRARPPTNLPPARTTFVGRAEEMHALSKMLDPADEDGALLLTLVGMAGCGKTRLALAVADMVRDAYRDGIRLVELAPLPAVASADPTAIAGAALAALGLREQPGRTLPATLLAHLQSKRILLVLDNCEHVPAASAALIERLLGACPELRILATSQQALGAVGETLWRVPTLGLPVAADGMPGGMGPSELSRSDAVQLFVERARSVLEGFELTAATAPSVAAICRQLDGLPLAIELAASRLNVLPVQDILSRLDDRFRLLRQGGRALVDRHQTLQATMDWSYELLDPAKQALLRRLAVFAGGWELAAVEAVCAGEAVEASTVLEMLERSLVMMHGSHDRSWYGLLETVRHYGLQRMEREGETALVRERHLNWCAELAEQSALALQGPEQGAWLARLEREHDNLRAAMRWALDHGPHILGLRVAAGLWQFWRSHSKLSEGRRWLAALLTAVGEADDAATMVIRATALEGAAWLAEDEHDFARASVLFAESGALRNALGQGERLTGLMINAAMEARAAGDYARASALLEESLARQRALGSRESIKRGGLGLSLARLGLVLAEMGEYERAAALYEECLALHRELGDREGIGNALLGLGDVARDQGNTAKVRLYCAETLDLFRELGHTWVGFSLNNLAQAAYLDGDPASAVSLAEESVAFFRGLQAGPSLAEVLITLGRVRGAHGDAAAARAALPEGLSLAWTTGPRLVVAAALEELGIQAARRGHAQYGVRLLAATATLRRTMGAPTRPAYQPALERALTAARASLGVTAFLHAWTTGQALSGGQLLAYASADPEDGSDVS